MAGQVHRNKRRRQGFALPSRRLEPLSFLTCLRGNTLRVPALAPTQNPAHRHLSEDATLHGTHRDHTHLLALAATNPAVSDRALRVYTVMVTVFDREVDSAAVAAVIPSLTQEQAARLLGKLTTAGLLSKRMRTVAYDGDRRVRRSVYRLAEGVHA